MTRSAALSMHKFVIASVVAVSSSIVFSQVQAQNLPNGQNPYGYPEPNGQAPFGSPPPDNVQPYPDQPSQGQANNEQSVQPSQPDNGQQSWLNPLKQAIQQQMPPGSNNPKDLWHTQGPIVVPPITFVDINSGRFKKLEIDLESGQFMDGAIDNLHFIARNLDLNEGKLSSLNVNVKGGHFQDFTFDSLTLATGGQLNFDTGILFNHKVLQFMTPATAQVSCVVSQKSLNAFLRSPRTLDRLSLTAQKKAGILTSLLGANAGLKLIGADAVLMRNNRVNLNVQTQVGIGNVGVPIPFKIDARLFLKDGWVELGDTHVITSGQEISPELSAALVRKVNSLSNWGSKSDDIHFQFTKLDVLPNDKFVLQGTAEVRRLRFGR